MHSHHSHSGDYVSHANGSLEEMVETAKEKQFTHFCLTEHMPRLDNRFLYPEELDKGYTIANLNQNFEKYIKHSREIQERESLAKQIQIIVGFEVEGIDLEHIEYAQHIKAITDMCVGSVHYVHGIPIDFDEKQWREAREKSGGTTKQLYRDYFDLQYQVISTLKPEVIGHFDLIRLFEVEDVDPWTGKLASQINLEQDWPDVWKLIQRNIKLVVSYGGLFELNSAAIRKGWTTPYPREDICRAIIEVGGKFCLSDDSHAYKQVGLNYAYLWEYVKRLELRSVYHLEVVSGKTQVVEASVDELSNSDFWLQYK